MGLHLFGQVAPLGPVDRPFEQHADRRGGGMLDETELRREIDLPRRQVGAAGNIANRTLRDDREGLDARLAVLQIDGAVEGVDRRSPPGQAAFRRADEGGDIVEGFEPGKRVDLAADRRQVHAVDDTLAAVRVARPAREPTTSRAVRPWRATSPSIVALPETTSTSATSSRRAATSASASRNATRPVGIDPAARLPSASNAPSKSRPRSERKVNVPSDAARSTLACSIR